MMISQQQPFVSSEVEKRGHSAGRFSTTLEANGGGE